jgi:PAS domain S-box-containing protein
MLNSIPLPIRILLITGSPDDEQTIRIQLEKDQLETGIQRVDNETDFTEALDPSIDLVFSAHPQPPFPSGRAIHLLRERGLHIPFVLISDMDEESLAKTAANPGVDDYLAKANLIRLGFIVRRSLEQKRLREREEYYHDIFENATVAIWDEDFSQIKVEIDKLRKNGVSDFRSFIKEHPEFVTRALKLVNILDANSATVRMYGVSNRAEVLGSLDKFVSPQNFQYELIAFAEGRAYFEREIRIQTRPGNLRDYLLTVTYYNDPAGRAKALVHLSDITERKQAEEAVRENEARYRAVVENQTEFIVRWKPDGTRTFVNEAYHRYFGITAEEATSSGFMSLIAEEDRKTVEEKVSRLLSGAATSEIDIHRVMKPDGSIGWQEWVDQAIYDEHGQIVEFQSVGRDITERKVAEENIRKQNEYLALLNDMTHAILLAKDFDSTLQTLAEYMANLIHADDCFIARWDEEKQKAIPIATTTNIGRIYLSYRDAHSKELKMVLSVLSVGHALAADDVYDSPYVDAEFVKTFPIRSGLGIPLIAGGHKLGAAVIAFNSPHHFTADEIEQAEQAGNQVALALWNFQQSVEIQQRLRESNALAKIERALSESERIGTGEVLQLIVDSARELMPNAQKSVIHLLDTKENVLLARAVSGYDGQDQDGTGIKMRVGEGVAGKVIQEGVTVNVSEIQSHPDFLLKDSSPDFRSLLVAPVQSSGQQIGTISVQSNAEKAFSAKDAELLNALAVQAAIAIENTRLFEATQQSLKEVNILYQISRGLAASLDADQLIRDMISLIQQSFGYYHVQVYLIDQETRHLVVRHGSGYSDNELVKKGYRIAAGEGIVGHVAETGECFMTNNVDEVVFFKRNPLLTETKSEMAIPIKIDDQVIGILDIQQIPDHGRFAESDLQLMTAIADHLAVMLQKANLYRTLQTALQQEKEIRSQLLQSERLALVGRLLASVSHELNNPLQAIHYGLFLLRDEANLSDQARQDIEVIIAEAERMASLIERLRSAYRPVRLRDFQPISLNRLIEDVYALIITKMRHSEIAFNFVPEPELPDVSGLPDQLRQVMLNLFLNAIEVMQPGGCLTVETHGLLQQNEVMLIVKDTGPGIDPEILPRVFDAFITSKHSGTGLGLTITHDIIQQHHGHIEAENDPEAGAIFKIWLPMAERSES